MPNAVADRYGLDVGILHLTKCKQITKGKGLTQKQTVPIKKPSIRQPSNSPQPCACRLGPRLPSAYPFTRVLDQSIAPETDYERTPSNVRHCGQLKLLLSEIEFLNQYRGAQHTVIYAGSAPGLHIPRLADMFPEMFFVLVDPNWSVVRGGNIKVIRGLMTVPLAGELSARFGRDTLFISDVRVGAETHEESDRDQQARIHKDMLSQFEWHDTLDPVASMFKFRLPWDLEPQTLYLEGVIQLPVFGKHLTHEARLIVQRDASLVPYDNRKYERQMAHFNRVQRVALYETGRCYDCTAFRKILGEYLGNRGEEEVEDLCRVIESEVARGWKPLP